MLKQKVLYKIKGLLDEWLLGFNEDDLKINMFSSEKFNIKNAIINSPRVNEEFYLKKIPLRLKAGIIGKLSVKVSNLTSSL